MGKKLFVVVSMSEPEKACPPSTERSTKRRKEMRVRAVSLSTAGRRAVGQPDKEGQRHDKQQGKDLMVVLLTIAHS